MRPEASEVKGGIGVSWGAEHRTGSGRLISRQISIEVPEPPQCMTFPCLTRYLKKALLFALLASYHARRVAYAEEHRNDEILERYRTGEPSPATIWQSIHANLKLRCPVCRKFDADPFLGRRANEESAR